MGEPRTSSDLSRGGDCSPIVVGGFPRSASLDGSLELWVDPSADPANTKFAVPVEGYTPDEDGVMVHYLLHVSVDGFMNELEVYREDSHRPIAVIDPERLEVLAL